MKTDFKKTFKNLYSPKAFTPGIVTVPKFNYLMVSGVGHPSDESFQMAAKTLFPVAYVSKFITKAKSREKDFTVMPMEVKWKLDRTQHGSSRYSWTMMVLQPDFMNKATIDEAIGVLKEKKKELPYENRLRLQIFSEGLCGQILHIGPYQEPMEQSFRILKQKLSKEGYNWEPDSHDVYYNDIRKTPPEKLKTLIRVRIWKSNEFAPAFDDPFNAWE